MPAHQPVEMDATEIVDFLESQLAGVLAMASGNDAYAIPVSFTFVPEESRLYFRLGYAPGSQKKKFVDATNHASFVAYDHQSAGWQSVVAMGRLVTLSKTNVDTSVLEALKHLDIPYFKIFERPTEEIDFTIVALHLGQINGRKETI